MCRFSDTMPFMLGNRNTKDHNGLRSGVRNLKAKCMVTSIRYARPKRVMASACQEWRGGFRKGKPQKCMTLTPPAPASRLQEAGASGCWQPCANAAEPKNVKISQTIGG